MFILLCVYAYVNVCVPPPPHTHTQLAVLPSTLGQSLASVGGGIERGHFLQEDHPEFVAETVIRFLSRLNL